MFITQPRPARRKVESDPNRPLIERALAMGVSPSVIAKRFGYSAPAIVAHRNRMPQQLKAAMIAAALKPKETDLDQLRIEESEGILGNLAHQRARLLMCQDEAMAAGAFADVNRFSNTIHRNIELVGRYLGLFAQHHVSASVNILVSEDYLRLRQAITMALRPFPEARRAVAAELHQLEDDIARRMLAEAGKAAPPPELLPGQYSAGTAFPPPSTGNGVTPIQRPPRPPDAAAVRFQRGALRMRPVIAESPR